jgi:hypothetical protein
LGGKYNGLSHNVPFSSLSNYARPFYDVGFTEAELGVKFVRNEAGQLSGFKNYNPLSELGRQINLEPVPAGAANTAMPAEGTPSLHNWSVPRAAQKLVVDEFLAGWNENYQELVKNFGKEMANGIAKLQAQSVMEELGSHEALVCASRAPGHIRSWGTTRLNPRSVMRGTVSRRDRVACRPGGLQKKYSPPARVGSLLSNVPSAAAFPTLWRPDAAVQSGRPAKVGS